MPTSLIDNKIREFLEQPRHCVLGTINRDGSPHLTVMWFELVDDIVVMNLTRDLIKDRNLRRDPRASVCIEDGGRFVTLSGTTELIEDRAIQEREVNRLSIRYVGIRLAAGRWDLIKGSDRIGVHLIVKKVMTHGFGD